MNTKKQIVRRDFIKSSALAATGILSLALISNEGYGKESLPDERENVIGPRAGFSPYVGHVTFHEIGEAF